MRHRIAHDPLAAGSSSRPSFFVESAFGDQTATPHDSETKEDANDGGCELPVHGNIDLGGAFPRGTAPSEAFEGRTGHAFTLQTPTVDSSSPNGGGKVQVYESLQCAVEWLVQCPDEVGIFRETLAFLRQPRRACRCLFVEVSTLSICAVNPIGQDGKGKKDGILYYVGDSICGHNSNHRRYEPTAVGDVGHLVRFVPAPDILHVVCIIALTTKVENDPAHRWNFFVFSDDYFQTHCFGGKFLGYVVN